MSYSTMLYAVDLGELKAAFGSQNSALLERVLMRMRQREGEARRIDPTLGPRVRVTWKSEIQLNGKQCTPDEFRHALLNPEFAGTNLYLYQERVPSGQRREGEFKEAGSFMSFLATLGPFFEQRGLIFKKHCIGIESCSTEDDFLSLRDPESEITEEQALKELVAGKLTRRDCAHVYGYALEHVCGTIGAFLGSVGTDRLRSLKLKTPLSKTQVPIKLPKIDDFPYISSLDLGELRAEVARLQAMDLTYPQEPEIETERTRFLEILVNAVAQNRGVIGFYY